MKAVIIDITGRNASQYNPSLCSSLSKYDNLDISLMSPIIPPDHEGYGYIKLIKIIPDSWASKEGKLKFLLRGLEVVLNYFYIFFYVLIHKPDVLHFQWLPLIEFAVGDVWLLKILKVISPNIRLFLTAHNVYPHNLDVRSIDKYKNRFKNIDKYLSGYLVHLNSTKEELSSEFSISKKKIYVSYHGIYVPEKYEAKINTRKNIKQIIMYGTQNRYKGVDILIEALRLLPKEMLSKSRTLIVGKTDRDIYEDYIDISDSLNIHWINKFVSDEELYKSIGESDLILLPYRRISQSGVLLLALSYRKPILTSDLPSFRETLIGYDDNWFFKSESPQALSEKLSEYLDGRLNVDDMISVINSLNLKYSWDNTAKSTYQAYIGYNI